MVLMTGLQQSLSTGKQTATLSVIEKIDQARPDLISSDISKPVQHKPVTFSVNMSQQEKNCEQTTIMWSKLYD